MVKKITNNDLNEAKKVSAVVDFSAVLVRTVPDVSTSDGRIIRRNSPARQSFTNADSDENMGLAQEYRIVSIPAVIVLKMAWKWQERLDPAERRNAQLYRGTSELERTDCELAHRLGTIWIAEWCAGRNEDYHAR